MTVPVDVREFFNACNPTKTIDYADPKERQYYVDFASVRGGELIDQMAGNITLSDEPTCQLFTGYRGCGKSTELSRLKTELEKRKFHVVCFKADDEINLMDVEVTDILLGVASQILKSIAKAEPKIEVLPTSLQEFVQRVADFLNAEVTGLNLKIPQVGDVGVSVKEQQGSLSAGILQITTKAKTTQNIRLLLNQRLGPQVDRILNIINQDLIEPVQIKLRQQGKAGLVVIVDNLDKVEDRLKWADRFQQEYLFISQGHWLWEVKCHKIYTIPAKLSFVDDPPPFETMQIESLPMVSVELRDGKENPQGMALLREMVMRRAFPNCEGQQLIIEQLITEVFDESETLDRLCQISGGHARNLLGYLYNCLGKGRLPLSRDTLEYFIRGERDRLRQRVQSDEVWQLLAQVTQKKSVKGVQEYQTLLSTLFVFGYRDEEGCWHNINPVLKEAEEFKTAIKFLEKQKEEQEREGERKAKESKATDAAIAKGG